MALGTCLVAACGVGLPAVVSAPLDAAATAMRLQSGQTDESSGVPSAVAYGDLIAAAAAISGVDRLDDLVNPSDLLYV